MFWKNVTSSNSLTTLKKGQKWHLNCGLTCNIGNTFQKHCKSLGVKWIWICCWCLNVLLRSIAVRIKIEAKSWCVTYMNIYALRIWTKTLFIGLEKTKYSVVGIFNTFCGNLLVPSNEDHIAIILHEGNGTVRSNHIIQMVLKTL